MAAIARHPELEALAKAARAVGGPAIRNMATVGGNLFAPAPYGDFAVALLALDAVAETRIVINAGWSQAGRLELQWAWLDYLALLAALERRPAAAARLCGCSAAAYDRLGERRETNEAAAFDRARRLAAAALGDSDFERLQAEGRSLRDEDIEALAFGSDTRASSVRPDP